MPIITISEVLRLARRYDINLVPTSITIAADQRSAEWLSSELFQFRVRATINDQFQIVEEVWDNDEPNADPSVKVFNTLAEYRKWLKA